MMQQVIVILIVGVCGVWAAWQAYRFFAPKPGGKMCGGNCCDNSEAPKTASTTSAPKSQRVMMISSDDIRARLKARKA